ncbi:MAG: dockerin type I domain-containing protein, partial [Planctomycetota bacterium]
VNHDGITTALDALILVNALNANANRTNQDLQTQSEGEFSMQQMDVNGDSMLTPLDVLQIINQLNSPAAEGEFGSFAVSPSAVARAYDEAIGQVAEPDSQGDRELDSLAAAQFLHWDLERRA